MPNNPSPFTDFPRQSTFYPVQSTESPVQQPQAPQSSQGDGQEAGSADRLSALPGNAISSSPYRSIRNERRAIPTSPSAPSLRSLLVRPFTSSPESRDVKPLPAEGSGQNSSGQRVLFEDSRVSAPTPNHSPRTNVQIHPLLREAITHSAEGIDSTMTRMNHSSDPVRPSSVVRLAGTPNSPKGLGHESPRAVSPPQSRASSPMRLLSWPRFYRTPEDPFVPINPFRIRLRHFSLHSPDIEHNLPFDPMCEENPLCCLPPLHPNAKDRFLSFLRDAQDFVLDTLPRQTYLLLLFRLPSLYFSRIARVYEDAQLSKPDLDRMIECYSTFGQQRQRQRIISPGPPNNHYNPPHTLPFPDEWTATNASPALIRFKQSWEAFIDSLLREWKTLNLVSALLESAIISMFQNPLMADDPVIRTAALLSMTAALMSLSYGCIYIVRFGTMRSMYKATRWAEEAARTTTFILWNVWVMLAMPAIWLAWSMIFFIVAILAFVWRYGSSADPTSPQLLSPTAAIGPRVAISALFFVGLLYLGAIVKTLHNYGRKTDGRLFSRTGNGVQNARGDDARGSPRRRRTSSGDGERGRETTRGTRGRDRTRRGREQDGTDPGKLSAVGLGLTGLDEVTSPHGSVVGTPKKQQEQTQPSA